MDIAARIEKNRTALLRMVYLWLLTINLLACSRDRLIPRRLCRWLLNLVSTAEKSTYFLTLAVSYRCGIAQCNNRKQTRRTERQTRARFREIDRCAKRQITIAAMTAKVRDLQASLLDLSARGEELARSQIADLPVVAINDFGPSSTEDTPTVDKTFTWHEAKIFAPP